ncbi:hypothetical protein C8R45DRAFT_1135640 [Mycena sanguinolenta]|nr:hypothetical protein C8R45DRAFT_1135640 [Mycena sanguinolenta]
MHASRSESELLICKVSVSVSGFRGVAARSTITGPHRVAILATRLSAIPRFIPRLSHSILTVQSDRGTRCGVAREPRNRILQPDLGVDLARAGGERIHVHELVGVKKGPQCRRRSRRTGERRKKKQKKETRAKQERGEQDIGIHAGLPSASAGASLHRGETIVPVVPDDLGHSIASQRLCFVYQDHEPRARGRKTSKGVSLSQNEKKAFQANRMRPWLLPAWVGVIWDTPGGKRGAGGGGPSEKEGLATLPSSATAKDSQSPQTARLSIFRFPLHTLEFQKRSSSVERAIVAGSEDTPAKIVERAGHRGPLR